MHGWFVYPYRIPLRQNSRTSCKGYKAMLQKLLWIALAGSLGTVARYGLAGWVYSHVNGRFPWGTGAVNLLGTFLFGVIWSLAEDRLVISGETRFIILTGFMGAFTTFSTFMFETGAMLRDEQWLLAFANLFFQIFAGLVCLFIGFAVGRLF